MIYWRYTNGVWEERDHDDLLTELGLEGEEREEEIRGRRHQAQQTPNATQIKQDEDPGTWDSTADSDTIIRLALWRRGNGGYRFAQDQIAKLLGGDRDAVIRSVRTAREQAHRLRNMNAMVTAGSDDTVIAAIAAMRRADGGYRFSANQIAALVGGNRNMVLSKVRETRAS